LELFTPLDPAPGDSIDQKPTILVLTSDTAFQKKVVVGAALANVAVVAAAKKNAAMDLLAAHPHSPVLVDVGTGSLGPSMAAVVVQRDNAVACYDGLHYECIQTLVTHDFKGGAIGKSSDLLHAVLADLTANSVHLRAGGAEAAVREFLPPASLIYRQIVTDSDDKDACLAMLMASAASRPGFGDLPRLIATVAWELLMNAIYSAPFDEQSQAPRYARVTRDQRVTLLPSEYVQLAHGSIDHYQALSVGDHFGRLSRSQVIKSLSRPGLGTGMNQVRRGNVGAGVGYYMMVQSVSLLSIRVVSGKSTTAVALFRQTKRRKDFVESAPCVLFHWESG